jgi:hypothetical protein
MTGNRRGPSVCGPQEGNGLIVAARRAEQRLRPATQAIGLGVVERSDRPVRPARHERHVDGASLVAREKGEFQPDVPAFVTGVAVLFRFGGVGPIPAFSAAP